jgi:hypothetical protein
LTIAPKIAGIEYTVSRHLAHASYPFFGLLAFAVDLTGPLDPTFVLPFSALVVAAAIRVSDLSVSASWRALCVALRWLARRFISFALCILSMGCSPEIWPAHCHLVNFVMPNFDFHCTTAYDILRHCGVELGKA